jgi:hypothetical protein
MVIIIPVAITAQIVEDQAYDASEPVIPVAALTTIVATAMTSDPAAAAVILAYVIVVTGCSCQVY